MTPDPRNVRDFLLEAGHTPEEVERMLRAVGGAELDEAIALIANDALGHQARGYHYLCPDCRRSFGHNSLCRSFRALELVIGVFPPLPAVEAPRAVLVSAAESSAGQSTPQPNPEPVCGVLLYSGAPDGPRCMLPINHRWHHGTPPAQAPGHDPNRAG